MKKEGMKIMMKMIKGVVVVTLSGAAILIGMNAAGRILKRHQEIQKDVIVIK